MTHRSLTSPRTKRAFIIGNNDYECGEKLRNAVNDAEDIAETLRSIQFQVKSYFNLNYTKMLFEISQFQKTIEEGDLVIFFFAGHGVQWAGDNYLVPVDNKYLIADPEMYPKHSICVQETLKTIMKKKPLSVIVLLDCCRKIPNEKQSENLPGTKRSMIEKSETMSVDAMKGVLGSLIVFACGSNEETIDVSKGGRNGLFTYHLLKHLARPNLKIEEMMCHICDGVYTDSGGTLFTHRASCLRISEIYLNKSEDNSIKSKWILPCLARWKMDVVTLFGVAGQGEGENQLFYPSGLFVDDDLTVYVADYGNHRIMARKANATRSRILIGDKGKGDRLNQLDGPTDLVVDLETQTMIISDRHNQRVMRWPLQNASWCQGEIVIDNISCLGLAMDDQGFIYVSDTEAGVVRRLNKNGDKKGIIVVARCNCPSYLFVDNQSTLYVSDTGNHCVIKWIQGAEKGMIVAGGNGQGHDLSQLNDPQGVWVDKCENIYVVDQGNDRVVCWEKGAREGTLVVGGNGIGTSSNQLCRPEGLFFDHHGHLYVTDLGNARVQRFSLISS